MNKSTKTLSCALIALIGLAGCGSVDQASGAVETLQPVGPREYATIPPVTAPPTTAPPLQAQPGDVIAAETIHVVAANESMPLIAAGYQVDLTALLEFNGMEANHVVNPGDRVRIPIGATMPSGPIAVTGGSGSTESGTAGNGDGTTDGSTPATNPSDNSGCTYTIVAGDNPTKIANKVGIPAADLIAANESSGVLEFLLIGDKLVVPPPGNC